MQLKSGDETLQLRGGDDNKIKQSGRTVIGSLERSKDRRKWVTDDAEAAAGAALRFWCAWIYSLIQKSKATTESKNRIKLSSSMSVWLDCFLELIWTLGIKYSTRDLIYGVNYSA